MELETCNGDKNIAVESFNGENLCETNNNLSESKVCFYCRQKATKCCSRCKICFYCCDEHEAIHRPDDVCFPFRIEYAPHVGNYMVASRDIEPAELILYDKAATVGPRMWSCPVCLVCLKKIENNPVTCDQCSWPVCGEKCANSHLKMPECEIFSRNAEKLDFSEVEKPHEHYRCIAPLRLLLLKDANPSMYQTLLTLMDHNEERKGDIKTWETYRTYVNDFLKKNCSLVKFTDDEIDTAVGLLWTNSFACASGGGQAIFPIFSLISHSCISNCTHSVFPNKHLALQARIKIKEGTEVSINYISSCQGKHRRRMKLKDKWYFTCMCERCSSATELDTHTSTLKCQENGVVSPCHGNIITTSPDDMTANWACEICKHEISPENVIAIENDLANVLKDSLQTSFDNVEKSIEELSNHLHTNHYIYLLAKRHLIRMYGLDLQNETTEKIQLRERLCKEVIGVLNVIEPGLNRERSLVLKDYAATKKILLQRKLINKEISEEEFSDKIQACVQLFNEYQECILVRFKKNENTKDQIANKHSLGTDDTESNR